MVTHEKLLELKKKAADMCDEISKTINRERVKIHKSVSQQELEFVTLKSVISILIAMLDSTIETIELRMDVLDHLVPEIKSTLLTLAESK